MTENTERFVFESERAIDHAKAVLNGVPLEGIDYIEVVVGYDGDDTDEPAQTETDREPATAEDSNAGDLSEVDDYLGVVDTKSGVRLLPHRSNESTVPVLKYIDEHPGCTSYEIDDALDMANSAAVLTYLTRTAVVTRESIPNEGGTGWQYRYRSTNKGVRALDTIKREWTAYDEVCG